MLQKSTSHSYAKLTNKTHYNTYNKHKIIAATECLNKLKLKKIYV